MLYRYHSVSHLCDLFVLSQIPLGALVGLHSSRWIYNGQVMLDTTISNNSEFDIIRWSTEVCIWFTLLFCCGFVLVDLCISFWSVPVSILIRPKIVICMIYLYCLRPHITQGFLLGVHSSSCIHNWQVQLDIGIHDSNKCNMICGNSKLKPLLYSI